MQQIRGMLGNLVSLFERALSVTSIYITGISWSAKVWHGNRVWNNTMHAACSSECCGVDVINQVPLAFLYIYLAIFTTHVWAPLWFSMSFSAQFPCQTLLFFVFKWGGWSQINYSICCKIQNKLPFPATDFNGQVCWRFWEHTTQFSAALKTGLHLGFALNKRLCWKIQHKLVAVFFLEHGSWLLNGLNLH